MLKQLYEINLSNKDDVRSYIETIYARHERIKRPRELQWDADIAWFCGEQNFVYSRRINNIIEVEKNRKKVHIILNIILPIVMRRVSKLMLGNPVWDVLPATGDPEDQYISRVSKKWLTFRWQQQLLTEKLIRALFWKIVTGNAFMRYTWDVDGGPMIPVDPRHVIENIEKYTEEQIKNILEDRGIRNGMLPVGEGCVEVRSPFNIMVCNNIESLEETQWLLDTSLVTKDELVKRHGSKAKECLTVADKDHFRSRFRPFLSTGVGNIHNQEPEDNSCLVHELWMNPYGKRYPKGWYVLLAGGKVLETKENPYDHRKIPYIHLREVFVPGDFWGISTVSQLRSPQSEYNKNKSLVIEHRNKIVNQKVWVHSSCKITNDLTNEVGEIVKFSGNTPPVFPDIPNIPSYVIRLEESLKSDIQDIASNHDVTEAKTPGGVRSGRAILALQEADAAVLAPVAIDIDAQLRKLGSFILQTDYQYVKEDRIVKIVGKNNEVEIAKINVQTLVNKENNQIGADYFDVRVDTYNRVFLNRGGQQQIIDIMLERGVLTPADRDAILRIYGFNQFNDIFDHNLDAEQRANQENEALSSGQYVAPIPTELFDVHIREHVRYQNTQEFLRLDDAAKKLHIDHYVQTLHLQYLEALKKQIYPQVLAPLAQQLVVNEAQTRFGNNGGASNGQQNGAEGGGNPATG